jgi:hypothetical protein
LIKIGFELSETWTPVLNQLKLQCLHEEIRNPDSGNKMRSPSLVPEVSIDIQSVNTPEGVNNPNLYNLRPRLTRVVSGSAVNRPDDGSL